MAVEIVSQPTGDILGTKYPIVYQFKDDANSSDPKFKFVVQVKTVEIGTNVETTIATFRTVANSNGHGAINLQRILDSYTKATIDSTNEDGSTINPIHTLGAVEPTTKTYSNNKETAVVFKVVVQSESAASDTSTPSINDGSAETDLTIAIPSWDYRSGLDPEETIAADYSFDPLSDVTLSDADDNLLSTYPTTPSNYWGLFTNTKKMEVLRDDYQVVAFINAPTLTGQLSYARYFGIYGYNAAGTQVIAGSLRNRITNGGLDSSTETPSNEHLLQYVGCGPANLQGQSFNAAIAQAFANTGTDKIVKYFVVPQFSAAVTTPVGNPLEIDIIDECRYPHTRVMFQNSYGGWDFFNFKGVRRESNKIERKTSERVTGRWADMSDSSANHWGYKGRDRGRKTLRTNMQRTVTLNTGLVSEDMNEVMREILASEEVFFVKGTDLIPVNVTDTSFDEQTHLNDKGINYAFTFEYSRNYNIG